MEPCRRTLAGLAAALSVAALLAGCVGPARTSEAYTKKASSSLDDTLSAVETARLAVDAAARDRATSAYLSVLIASAEKQASDVQATFDSIQPPGKGLDRLRHDVDDVLTEAVSVLGDLRIAARRGDTAGVTDKGHALEDLSRRLNEAKERLG